LLVFDGFPAGFGRLVESGAGRAADAALQAHIPQRRVAFAVDADAAAREGCAQRTVGHVRARRPRKVAQAQFGSAHPAVNPVARLQIGLELTVGQVGKAARRLLPRRLVALPAATRAERLFERVDVARLPSDLRLHSLGERTLFTDGLIGGHRRQRAADGRHVFAQTGLLLIAEVEAVAEGVVEGQTEVRSDAEQDIALVGQRLFQGGHGQRGVGAAALNHGPDFVDLRSELDQVVLIVAELLLQLCLVGCCLVQSVVCAA
jgi:hypothetical protein